MESLLREMGVEVIRVGLSYGAMHLLEVMNFTDRELVVAWPDRVPYQTVEAVREQGYEVLWLPDEAEARQDMALNFDVGAKACADAGWLSVD